MSDSESGSGSEEEEVVSLDDVQVEFKTEVGHLPHSVKQLLAFCRQKKYPHKFKDINGWWPNRPSPEEKPVEKAVNADDYRDPSEVAAQKGSDDDASDAEQPAPAEENGDGDDDDDNKDEKEDDAEEAAEEEPAADADEAEAEADAEADAEEEEEEDADEEDEDS